MQPISMAEGGCNRPHAQRPAYRFRWEQISGGRLVWHGNGAIVSKKAGSIERRATRRSAACGQGRSSIFAPKNVNTDSWAGAPVTSRLVHDSLFDRLQLFARLETHGLARRDGHFGAGARVASDASLARTHVEHAKASQLDAIALGQRALHALEYGFHRHLGFGLGDAGRG